MDRLLLALVITTLTAATTFHSLRKTITYDCGPCVCYLKKSHLVADCSSRGFSAVPHIPDANRISALVLDFNNLTELGTSNFSSFTRLVRLSLANNIIDTIETGAFEKLETLKKLNLTGNRLKYTNRVFKSDVFKPLKSLKTLSLTHNANLNDKTQTYPTPALATLTSLQDLYLDGLPEQSFGEEFSKLSSLKLLSFGEGYCNMSRLFNRTFLHVRQVVALDLSFCHITDIEPATFSPMKNSLIFLDLSDNRKLGFKKIGIGAYGWQNSSLQVLRINRIVAKYAICIQITRENLKYFTATHLNEIHADGNRIEAFERGAIPKLPKTLQKISLQNERFTAGKYMQDLIFLANLTEIDLSGPPGLHRMPSSAQPDVISTPHCSAEDEPSCSSLDKRLFHTDKSKFLFCSSATSECRKSKPLIVNLPLKLNKIKSTFKQISYCISTIKIEPNSLTELDISHNLLSLWIGPIIGLEKLKNLDLSNNLATCAEPQFFQNFHSLVYLNISWNLLNDIIIQDEEGTLFQNLTSLRILDLSGNTIQKFHANLFKGLVNLETLKASRNNLYLEKLYARHMKNLKFIDLSHNMLRWLSKRLMDDLDSIVTTQNHSVVLDLSQNPISCECHNLHFLRWMLNSKVKQRYSRKYYYCLDSYGKNYNLRHLYSIIKNLEKECSSDFGLDVGISLAVIFFVFVIIGGIIYKYRWKLIFTYNNFWLSFKEHQNLGKKYPYDAYISYSEEDERFYNDMLANKQNKIFVSKNNISPTESELRRIVDLIAKSRKTVLLLSRNFLHDGMRNRELQEACTKEARTGEDVIMIVMLENIPDGDIPEEIKLQIKRYTYTEYDEQKEDFWKKFIEEI